MPADKNSLIPAIRKQLPKLPGFSAHEAFQPQLSPEKVWEPMSVIIRNPTSAWKELRSRRKSFQKLYGETVFFLAAIPALSGLIGYGIFSDMALSAVALVAALGYVFSLLFVYAACWLAHGLAKLCRGETSLDHAANLVIYSLMPFFFTGLFLLHPQLAPFVLCGTYSVFLFHRGVEEMTVIPQEKQLLFSGANVVLWLLFVDRVLAILF